MKKIKEKGIKTAKQKDGKYSLHLVRKYFQEKKRKEVPQGQDVNSLIGKEIVLCKFMDGNQINLTVSSKKS